MRCLTLADALAWAGWSCTFAVGKDSVATVPRLPASPHRVVVVEENTEAASVCAGARIAVVDHYGLDAGFEQLLASPQRVLIVFDDLANRRHVCDVLVDPTPGRSREDYAAHVPASARILLGPPHAMIHQAWRAERIAASARLADGPPVGRILVSMGATDPVDASSRVCAAIAAAGLDTEVDVVLGAGAPHLARVAAIAGGRMTLHVDPDGLPGIAARADLAVGACGSSSFERASLGLPAILIPIVDNQVVLAAALATAGAAEVAPAALLDDPRSLGARIAALAADRVRRAAMSRAAAAVTDARGPARLLAAIAGSAATRSGVRVHLRLAEAEDENWLLELQREPATRRHARNPAVPSASTHAEWFSRVIADGNRLLMVVEADDRAAGFVRLDRIGGEPVTFEVSIAVAPQLHGQGVGRAVLDLVRRLAPGADLVATVLPGNHASMALFTKAGYRPEGRDRMRSEAA
jgi:UDP-2,4-diacetamido-2,4,6-trideoxy-beta-L-altropyranose hydrolase